MTHSPADGPSTLLPPPETSGPVILIVDDSPIDRRLMTRLLEADGQYQLIEAADGLEALDVLQTTQPDLVVTDLQMPNMNGLELLQAIGDRYPSLSVVVITARGSEQLAVEAIEGGAASYVPKSRLADDLAATLSRVLSFRRSDSLSDHVSQSLVSAEAVYELPADPEVLTAAAEMVDEMIQRSWNCPPREGLRIRMVLEEALLNALYHGTLELPPELRASDLAAYYELARERQQSTPWQDRTVALRVSYSPDELVLEVADEGPGFEGDSFLDLTEAAVLERPYGRGILLMRTVMDEISFEDDGRVTRLLKKRSSLIDHSDATADDDVFSSTDLSDSAFLLELGNEGLDDA
jgi:CheY-like chemotaxis protein/anti-sigma regulatory factor (Ser/Thr protein kinase)